MRRAKGRVGGNPRVLRDIVKACRRPHRFARCRFACPTGTAVSQGFRPGGGRSMAFRRGAWLPMSRIATPRAPGRKPWETVSMGRYQRDLVLAANHRTRHLLAKENHRHRTGYVDNSLPRVLAHTHCPITTALSSRNPMVDPKGTYGR